MWLDTLLGIGDTVMNKIDKNCILHEACILVRYKQKLRKTYSKFYSRIKRDKYQEEKIKG